MKDRAPQARHCSRNCGKAYNARLNRAKRAIELEEDAEAPPLEGIDKPTGLFRAPTVSSTERLSDRWLVCFDDGRAVEVPTRRASSAGMARAAARWSVAEKVEEPA